MARLNSPENKVDLNHIFHKSKKHRRGIRLHEVISVYSR